MEKSSVLKVLLKLFGLFILSWILWLFIFSIFTPENKETVVEPFRGASFIFGLGTCLIVYTGLSYNDLFRRKQSIKAMTSNILVAEERSESLLSKANRVVEKYQEHEHDTFVSINSLKVDNRSGNIVGNSEQFHTIVQGYPELKANSNVLELLKQIKECENTIANFKIDYNSEVKQYNTLINSFPGNLIRRIANFEEADYYTNKEKNEEITDEMLGI